MFVCLEFTKIFILFEKRVGNQKTRYFLIKNLVKNYYHHKAILYIEISTQFALKATLCDFRAFCNFIDFHKSINYGYLFLKTKFS